MLAAKVRGEFLVHESFGEGSLRDYLVTNHPDLLAESDLLADGEQNPLQEHIRKAEKSLAVQWAWTVAICAALPMLFAWSQFVGSGF